MRHRWTASPAALLAALVLTACGVEVQRAPEPVPADRLPTDRIAPAEPGRTEQVRIWGARDRRLVPVFVELRRTGLRARLDALLELGEPGQRPPTALPEGVRLIDLEQEADEVDVVLSEELHAVSVQDLPLALGQIVFTATELPGTRRVQVRIGDQRLVYVDAQGRTLTRPFVRSDFDGLVLGTVTD